MARRPDDRYIRYYTDGSAARQLEPKTPKKKTTLPRAPKQKKYAIYVDPLAIGGILVSAVLLVMMLVGSVQLFAAQQQAQVMEDHVIKLQQTNAQLKDTYETGIDLELIEKSALALGMIPEEDAQHITISVPMPEAEEEPTLWERIAGFFEGLFA